MKIDIHFLTNSSGNLTDASVSKSPDGDYSPPIFAFSNLLQSTIDAKSTRNNITVPVTLLKENSSYTQNEQVVQSNTARIFQPTTDIDNQWEYVYDIVVKSQSSNDSEGEELSLFQGLDNQKVKKQSQLFDANNPTLAKQVTTDTEIQKTKENSNVGGLVDAINIDSKKTDSYRQKNDSATDIVLSNTQSKNKEKSSEIESMIRDFSDSMKVHNKSKVQINLLSSHNEDIQVRVDISTTSQEEIPHIIDMVIQNLWIPMQQKSQPLESSFSKDQVTVKYNNQNTEVSFEQVFGSVYHKPVNNGLQEKTVLPQHTKVVNLNNHAESISNPDTITSTNESITANKNLNLPQGSNKASNTSLPLQNGTNEEQNIPMRFYNDTIKGGVLQSQQNVNNSESDKAVKNNTFPYKDKAMSYHGSDSLQENVVNKSRAKDTYISQNKINQLVGNENSNLDNIGDEQQNKINQPVGDENSNTDNIDNKNTRKSISITTVDPSLQNAAIEEYIEKLFPEENSLEFHRNNEKHAQLTEKFQPISNANKYNNSSNSRNTLEKTDIVNEQLIHDKSELKSQNDRENIIAYNSDAEAKIKNAGVKKTNNEVNTVAQFENTTSKILSSEKAPAIGMYVNTLKEDDKSVNIENSTIRTKTSIIQTIKSSQNNIYNDDIDADINHPQIENHLSYNQNEEKRPESKVMSMPDTSQQANNQKITYSETSQNEHNEKNLVAKSISLEQQQTVRQYAKDSIIDQTIDQGNAKNSKISFQDVLRTGENVEIHTGTEYNESDYDKFSSIKSKQSNRTIDVEESERSIEKIIQKTSGHFFSESIKEITNGSNTENSIPIESTRDNSKTYANTFTHKTSSTKSIDDKEIIEVFTNNLGVNQADGGEKNLSEHNVALVTDNSSEELSAKLDFSAKSVIVRSEIESMEGNSKSKAVARIQEQSTKPLEKSSFTKSENDTFDKLSVHQTDGGEKNLSESNVALVTGNSSEESSAKLDFSAKSVIVRSEIESLEGNSKSKVVAGIQEQSTKPLEKSLFAKLENDTSDKLGVHQTDGDKKNLTEHSIVIDNSSEESSAKLDFSAKSVTVRSEIELLKGNSKSKATSGIQEKSAKPLERLSFAKVKSATNAVISDKVGARQTADGGEKNSSEHRVNLILDNSQEEISVDSSDNIMYRSPHESNISDLHTKENKNQTVQGYTVDRLSRNRLKDYDIDGQQKVHSSDTLNYKENSTVNELNVLSDKKKSNNHMVYSEQISALENNDSYSISLKDIGLNNVNNIVVNKTKKDSVYNSVVNNTSTEQIIHESIDNGTRNTSKQDIKLISDIISNDDSTVKNTSDYGVFDSDDNNMKFKKRDIPSVEYSPEEEAILLKTINNLNSVESSASKGESNAVGNTPKVHQNQKKNTFSDNNLDTVKHDKVFKSEVIYKVPPKPVVDEVQETDAGLLYSDKSNSTLLTELNQKSKNTITHNTTNTHNNAILTEAEDNAVINDNKLNATVTSSESLTYDRVTIGKSQETNTVALSSKENVVTEIKKSTQLDNNVYQVSKNDTFNGDAGIVDDNVMVKNDNSPQIVSLSKQESLKNKGVHNLSKKTKENIQLNTLSNIPFTERTDSRIDDNVSIASKTNQHTIKQNDDKSKSIIQPTDTILVHTLKNTYESIVPENLDEQEVIENDEELTINDDTDSKAVKILNTSAFDRTVHEPLQTSDGALYVLKNKTHDNSAIVVTPPSDIQTSHQVIPNTVMALHSIIEKASSVGVPVKNIVFKIRYNDSATSPSDAIIQNTQVDSRNTKKIHLEKSVETIPNEVKMNVLNSLETNDGSEKIQRSFVSKQISGEVEKKSEVKKGLSFVEYEKTVVFNDGIIKKSENLTQQNSTNQDNSLLKKELSHYRSSLKNAVANQNVEKNNTFNNMFITSTSERVVPRGEITNNINNQSNLLQQNSSIKSKSDNIDVENEIQTTLSPISNQSLGVADSSQNFVLTENSNFPSQDSIIIPHNVHIQPVQKVGIPTIKKVASMEIMELLPVQHFADKAHEYISSKTQGNGTVRMVLQPEELGTVIVRYSTLNSDTQLQIQVDSQQTKQIIESQLPQLKDQFGKQGMQLDSVEVTVRKKEEEMSHNSQYSSHNRQGQSQQEQESRQQFTRSFKYAADARKSQTTVNYTTSAFNRIFQSQR